MDATVLLFLSSGLFLGWSLGSNDAANVFGTAVGSRMVRFKTAAIICAVFVVLGAVFGGAGAAHGLGKLGAVNALAGSFMVALSAAVTVYAMTKLGLPVSTTQAIVGAIVGWNIFSGSLTDYGQLSRIVGTWIACPILGCVFALVLYKLTVGMIRYAKWHLLTLDLLTRWGLVLAGAFGAYSLGANNIGNVMGVFVESSPFETSDVAGLFTLTSVQKLFLVGGLSIAVGVFYSRRVMMTVGGSLMPVSPVGAWVVVVAQSLVLFVFSSTQLEQMLLGAGLPALPLVPVSSSQAVVGAVIGVGLARGFRGVRQVRWSVLAGIGSGWASTPAISAVICFVMLFFLQNVFQQQVFAPVHFEMSAASIAHLEEAGVETTTLESLRGQRIESAAAFRKTVREYAVVDADDEARVLAAARIHRARIDKQRLAGLDSAFLGQPRAEAVGRLAGQSFTYDWQLRQALAAEDATWKPKEATRRNRVYNKKLDEQFDYVSRTFHLKSDTAEP